MMDQMITDFMSHDHDKLDTLFRNYVANKKNENKAKEFFAAFKGDLELHIVWEEDILFPIFEEKTGILGPTECMKIEHREIKNYLEKISNGIGKVATDIFEVGLLEVLGAHNQKEEFILYPQIDHCVPAEEREAILQKMKVSKMVLRND